MPRGSCASVAISADPLPLRLLPALQQPEREQREQQRLNGFEQLPGARVAPLVPGVGAVRSCAAAGTLCTPEHFCTPSSQTKEVRHTGTTPPPLRAP